MTPLAAAPAPCYCRRCPLPAYCSAACRDADPSHQPGGPECCLPWTVLLPPDAVAAVRLARRLRLEQGREAQQGGSESGESGGGWGAAAARQVAALGTHFADLPTGELAQLAALAAVAHATWQAAAAGAEPATPAAAVSAGDVLGALCRLQVNGLAVVPPQRRGSEDRRGLALYPVGALMNHSCRPNVSVRFQARPSLFSTYLSLPPLRLADAGCCVLPALPVPPHAVP